jgi:rare lipoprotein A
MKILLLSCLLLIAANARAADGDESMRGVASWYGEAHRGKPMANRVAFDPDKLTAASWFYPLGTRVCVTLESDPARSVIVTITDRGPARRFVRRGRVIDLAHAAFKQLASPDLGLVAVRIEAIGDEVQSRSIVKTEKNRNETDQAPVLPRTPSTTESSASLVNGLASKESTP